MTTSLRYITEFRGAYAFLNNFYRHSFTYRNLVFLTSEHAFHFDKTDDMEWKMRIHAAPTPQQAKQLGRQAPLADGWQAWRRYVSMESVLAAKFAPGSVLAQYLVSTGQTVLIEGNRWHDNDWGVCYCSNCTGQGRNLLGWMLMRQRYLLTRGL